MQNTVSTNVTLGFRTCTIMEAIEEINIALKNAGYTIKISEYNLINETKCDKEDPDDFDDYYFEFLAKIADTFENIVNKIEGIDVGLVSY